MSALRTPKRETILESASIQQQTTSSDIELNYSPPMHRPDTQPKYQGHPCRKKVRRMALPDSRTSEPESHRKPPACRIGYLLTASAWLGYTGTLVG